MPVLFVTFGGLCQLIGIWIGFHKLYFAVSVVVPIALISIYCVLLTVSDSDFIDCGHEHTQLLSSTSFRRRECSCSSRRPTVPILFTIIIIKNGLIVLKLAFRYFIFGHFSVLLLVYSLVKKKKNCNHY